MKSLLTLLLLTLTAACGRELELVRPAAGTPRSAELLVAGQTVTVELASTPSQRTYGLKHRPSMASDHGMLFLFPDTKPRTFWMQDTLIGLDIIFLAEDGTVINIEEASPGVERPGFPSRRPARFVLELIRGWSREHGLSPGQVIEVAAELAALAEPAAGP